MGKEESVSAVTVVMTVHNGARFLRQAIDSVLGQTLRDFQFLIVDDVSTDETPAILAAAASADGRIEIIRNDRNIGPYPSANRALEVASAPLIARMDADDISEPERLARQVQFMRDNPDHLLVATSYVSIDAQGAIRYRKRNPMDAWQTRWTSRFRMPSVHPGFCFRAALPDGTPVRYGEDNPVAQDYALAARLAHLGKAAVLDYILIRYRMHGQNISSTRPLHQRQVARQVAQHYLAEHYPPDIVDGVGTMLDVHFRLLAPDAETLGRAARALARIPAFDDDSAPRRRTWLARRCAGMLAEAFLAGRTRREQVRIGAALLGRGAGHLPALAMRLAELRGWLPTAGEVRP